MSRKMLLSVAASILGLAVLAAAPAKADPGQGWGHGPSYGDHRRGDGHGGHDGRDHHRHNRHHHWKDHHHPGWAHRHHRGHHYGRRIWYPHAWAGHRYH